MTGMLEHFSDGNLSEITDTHPQISVYGLVSSRIIHALIVSSASVRARSVDCIKELTWQALSGSNTAYGCALVQLPRRHRPPAVR